MYNDVIFDGLTFSSGKFKKVTLQLKSATSVLDNSLVVKFMRDFKPTIVSIMSLWGHL